MEFAGVKLNASRVRSMERIVCALLDIMREEKFDDVTVTAICEASGVTRRTFYRIFQSKESVIESRFDMMFLELTQNFDFAECSVKDVIKFCFDYFNRERAFAAVFKDAGLYDVIRQKIKEYIKIAYDYTLYNASSFEPAYSEFYHNFMAVGIMSLVKTWVEDNFKQPVKTMAILAQRLLSGVIA